MRRELQLGWFVVVLVASCTEKAPSNDDDGALDPDAGTRCSAHSSRHGSDHACTCDDGFIELASSMTVCIDVDECASNAADCSPNAKCTNTTGSYECSCLSGFEGDGRNCSRPDACADVDCVEPASCAVEAGVGVCVCPDGYTAKGNGCADVDECQVGTADCADAASCENADGGYSCKCNAGFDGDGKTCTARTECMALGLDCAEHASCVERRGLFDCVCDVGYQGDGESCSDIDECALHADNCNAAAICTNTAGSFSCACRTGFSGDGVQCADIDECVLGTDNCNASGGQQCSNVAGSFHCSCAPGRKLVDEVCVVPDTTAPTCTISADSSQLRAGQTAVITFELSEPPSDFEDGDITVDGGSLGPLTGDGTTYSAIFTPSPNVALDAHIALEAERFTGSTGTPNSAATPLLIGVDTQLPSITVLSDASVLKVGQTATLTFTVSEPVTSFALEDLIASGGTLSAFGGSDLTYTATFTPVANMTASATIDVAADAFTDAAGNPNLAATQLGISVTTREPTIMLSSDVALLNVGSSATITFSLSEAASDFTAQDVTVVGGSLSGFSGSGATYTAILTPSADSTTSATVDVAGTTFSNADGNANVAAEQLVIDLDTVAPTLVISSDVSALKIGETATLTFGLSEAALDFVANDIVVSGGTLGSLAGSGTSYTATFTPAASATTSATVGVGGSRFTDPASNGNVAAVQLTLAVDTLAPTVVISSDLSALKSGQSANLTFTLSEPSTNFSGAGIQVTGGTLGAISGSGSSYSALFTPTSGIAANASVDLDATSFSDVAGNGNLAASQLLIPVDTIVPTITIQTDDSLLNFGEVATLSFTLSEAASDFAVGDVVVSGGTLGVLSGSGALYSASFTPTPNASLTATVDVAASRFSDAAGNGNLAATQLTISVSTQVPCGDGIVAGAEQCDDPPPAEDGDGCSATCTIETGFNCAGSPSICTTTCGDGITAGSEQCDDAPPAENGDGCSSTCTMEPGFTCTGTAPSTCNSICGDGFTVGSEQCDDGCAAGTPGLCESADNGDGCSSTCTLECGNGVLNGSEQCDDGGRNNGDGCSSTCAFELSCGVGETLVQVRSTDVPKAIPDNNVSGVDSNVVVPFGSQGVIHKVMVGIGRITHTYDADLLLSVLSPNNRRRNLIVNRGVNSQNLITTRFDDSAASAINAGTAPFSGAFRPEQTISDTAGYSGIPAAGTWQLRAVDSGTGDVGTIVGWTLSLCVDTNVICGNGAIEGTEECDDANLIDSDACSNVCTVVDGCGDGNLDGGEACDDDNVVSDDGCSSTCQVDIGCGAGETAVIVSNNTAFGIPDSTPLGIVSPVTVATVGAVRRASVFLGGVTHPDDGDLDMYLVSPGATERELSTDNVSGGQNFTRTSFDDGADTSITAGAAPFTARFRSEQTLSTTPGKDFRDLNAAGTWKLHVIDDAAGDTGTLQSWTLALCVDPSAAYCGDNVTNGSEECDDGNLVAADSCNNLCQVTDGCGDGNLDSGEECDDDNKVSGDGCSATCTFDISCGSGEVAVVLSNTTATAVPDNPGGLLSAIAVAQTGVVRKVIPSVSISHAVDAHLDIFLISPYGVQRELSTDQIGVNYIATSFSDAAATLITAASAPYTGTFRPEQTISSDAPSGFANQTATGSWSLRVSDDSTGTAGTLNRWSLALCVDSSVSSVCGNGIVELTEQCDDGNTVGGDGCSTSCQIELSCPLGQSLVVARASDVPKIINDNSFVGVSSSVNVATSGTVSKAILVFGAISHANDAHIDATLISPSATTIDVSSDNGGTGDDYVSTVFDDAAAVAITVGVSPFRGRFRPEAALSAFNNQSALGTWTLNIVDDSVTDTGVLGGWTLALCVQ